MKTIKESKGIKLIKLNTPVFGGFYAIQYDGRYKDGLCLGAANDLFRTLVKLTK